MPELGDIVCPLPSRRQIHGHVAQASQPSVPIPPCPYPSRRSLNGSGRPVPPSSPMGPNEGDSHPGEPGSRTRNLDLRELHPRRRDSPELHPGAPDKDEVRRHGVGRASLLVALSAMTVVVPVAGFVGPASSVALPSRAVGSPAGGDSWAGTAQSGVTEATELSGTVTAASRAKTRAPLEATKCLAATAAADGTRAVIEEPELLWPLTQGSYTVTSGFSMRISPVSGQLLMHDGVDMSAPLGTPVHAVADGVVVELTSDYRSGTFLRIQHTAPDGSTFYSAYAHEYMDDILVTVGDQVTAGQQIGAVGSNGWSTGPHLHFEIHDSSDTPVEPLGWMQDRGASFVGQECP